jgi:hypothetical protein
MQCIRAWTVGRHAMRSAIAALGCAGAVLVGTAPARDERVDAAALADAAVKDDAPPASESRMGIDSLLARETARMRESLASAALGTDHALLLARKRSTDWAFLAAAVTAGIGHGVSDPAELLASVSCCDHRPTGPCTATPGSGAPRRPWLVPTAGAAPVTADVVTYFAEPSGSDFPCAIGWRVIVDSEGVLARALWHEPMMALRGFDAPLVPDRTTVRLSPQGTELECWGFGSMADPWPESPAPLDQPADAYDLADAARHWWWSRAAAVPPTGSAVSPEVAAPAPLSGPSDDIGILLAPCDIERVSPWRVDSLHAADMAPPDAHPSAPDGPSIANRIAGSTRASMAVTLRHRPSWLRAHPARDPNGRLRSLRVEWIDAHAVRAALTWTAHPVHGGMDRHSISAPSHGWLDAQARIQLLQNRPLPEVLPEPYGQALVIDDSADGSASHARATANVWQAALAGSPPALAQALSDAELLRRRRGVPRSTDAMALVALAESLLERGAPERSIALVMARHHAIAQGLPADWVAACAETPTDAIAPPIPRDEYRKMLIGQGRMWAADHCMVGTGETSPDDRHGLLAAAPADPIVSRFNEWHAKATAPAAPT